MLQQILKDMYIDPDVLEALNEEQKKILFLKMRQEQVRRWTECEEKLEREGRATLKPKLTKAHAKTVSWLLGRDGDVQVYVIGEADEVRSSKFIYSELGQVKAPSEQNNARHQSNAIRSSLGNNRACPEPEKAPSPSHTSQIQLQVNGVQPASDSSQTPQHSQNSGDLKSVSHSPPLEVPQAKQQSSSPADPEEKDDDDSGTAAESLVGTGLYYRSHLSRDSSPSIADRLRPLDTLRADLQSSIDRLRAQEAQGDDVQEGAGSKRLWRNGGRDSLARGRVAQLMKAFGTPIPKQNTLSRRKPPLPNKPTHLLMATSTPR